MEDHHKRLVEARRLARRNLLTKAMERCERHNVGDKDEDMPVGTIVHVIDHPTGRTKIQDTWRPDTNKVVERRQGSTAS